MPDPDAFADWIVARAAEGMASAGRGLAAEVAEGLGTPSPAVVGPRGGLRFAGARHGGYPYLRTGRLQAGATSDVEVAGDLVTLTVDDPVAYAAPLQARGYTVTSAVADKAPEVTAAAVVAAINAG